jgi:hypothetical protein
MSQFLDPLNVTEISDSVFAICDHPFRYQSNLAGLLTVPVGFYTDFASVPRLGIVYAMLGDRAHEPAVVHDWLYYAAITTREMADNVLMEAMNVMGLPFWQRYPILWGVRIGGWHAWNQHRKDGHPETGKFSTTPNISK